MLGASLVTELDIQAQDYSYFSTIITFLCSTPSSEAIRIFKAPSSGALSFIQGRTFKRRLKQRLFWFLLKPILGQACFASIFPLMGWALAKKFLLFLAKFILHSAWLGLPACTQDL